MSKGTIWISKELAVAARLIAREQTGVSQAVIAYGSHSKMVTIEYYYPIAAMKMFIAHELDRKIRLLKGETQ